MEKAFEKVKKMTSDVFHYCCFGSTTGGVYGYEYSRPNAQMSLIEPFLDDAIHHLADKSINDYDVEMFVFILDFSKLLLSSFCSLLFPDFMPKKTEKNSFLHNLFYILSSLYIDTFSGLKCNQKKIGANCKSTRFCVFLFISLEHRLYKCIRSHIIVYKKKKINSLKKFNFTSKKMVKTHEKQLKVMIH